MCRVARTYQSARPIVIQPCHGSLTTRPVTKASVEQLECALAWLGQVLLLEDLAPGALWWDDRLARDEHETFVDAVYAALADSVPQIDTTIT